MTNLKKILAMVLVLAMTFTMLPVFAAADDETAAVQTVEAPAAAEPVAVEDVAPVTAEAPAAAPVAEAIETVAAEPVAPKAELQATGSFTSDADAIAAGFYWKKTVNDVTTYYDAGSLSTALGGTGTCYQLCDYYWYDGASGSSLPAIGPSAKCDTWLDMQGFTLTARMAKPLFGRNTGTDSPGNIKIKNGTIIYTGNGATSSGRRPAVISMGQTANVSNTVCTVALDHVNLYSLERIGSAYPFAIANCFNYSDVILTDSTVISMTNNAVYTQVGDISLSASQKSTVLGRGGFHHNIEINGTCVIGSTGNNAAIGYRFMPTTDAEIAAFDHDLTITVEDMANTTFLGNAVVKNLTTGNTDSINYIDAYESEEYEFTLPQQPTGTASSTTYVPEARETANACTGWIHVHVIDIVEEVAATVTEYGVREHYSCESCGKNFQDPAGEIEATEEWLRLPKADCAHGQVTHTDAVPATYTATGMAEYWTCDLCGRIFADAECTNETTLDSLVTPVAACPHANVTHTDAVPATYTATGMAEYWTCGDCGRIFADAEYTAETTLDALVTPILACPHATPEEHPATPATFASTGSTAYWSCPDCLKYFSDAECTTEIAEGSWTDASPKLEDATGYTDAELVELGAIAKLTAPDGAVTAYSSLQTAGTEAGAWTTSGGELKLLRDYTVISSTATASPFVAWSTGSAAPVVDETLGVQIYGFWLDLGGHTLTITGPRPGVGRTSFTNVNVRNGRFIYRNTGRTAAVCGAINIGALGYTPMSGSTILTPHIVISDAEIVSLSATSTGYSQSVIDTTFWSNEVQIFNSKLVSQYAYGVYFHKSSALDTANAGSNSAKLTDAQIAILQENGVQNNLSLHNSVVGSLNTSRAAITYTPANASASGYPFGYYEGIEHSVNITADADSRFLGGGIIGDNSTSKIDLKKNLPEGDQVQTTYSYALPDVNTIAEASAVDAKPADLAAAEYNAICFGAHVHGGANATHHEAIAATYAAPGNTEYWSCSCGKYYSDADCTLEIDENSWVIPQLVCDHAAKEFVAEIPATFVEPGVAAHYYCAACETYWDATGETEITEADLAIAKLEPTDAAGKTDAELVELGAVVKTTSPDGATVKVFDNIKSGYSEAATWTEVGGELILLKDFTWDDPACPSVTGGKLSGDLLPSRTAYENTVDVPEMPTKGFWFDLGGHTLTAHLGQAMFANSARYVNLKNGKIIYQNVTRSSALIFGMITGGYTSGSSWDGGEAYQPVVNFCDMEVYTLQSAENTVDPSKPFANAAVVSYSIWNFTVNVKDSKLITANDQAAIEYHRASATPTGANLTAMQEVGSNLCVNILGGSTIGSLNTAASGAIAFDIMSSSTTVEGIAYQATVTAAEDTVFLGKRAIYNSSSFTGKGGYMLTTPKDEYLETTRNFAIPALEKEAEDYTAWVHASAYPEADAPGLTTETDAKAILTYGEKTAYFDDASNAFACAEKICAVVPELSVKLTGAATETYALGSKLSALSLDVNGQALPEAGLFDISKVSSGFTLTMAAAGSGKLFTVAPVQTFAKNNKFVVEKGSLFTDYSLNLEDDVKMNLYTLRADSVGYVQGEETYLIDAAEENGAWVIDTIAAKQMADPIDAYAFRKSGSTIKIDYTKGISVKSYVDGDPAATLEAGDEKTALEATLKTLLVYGKYAEKYFAEDYTDLTPEELASIGLTEIPVTDLSNLTDAAYTVTDMEDLKVNTDAASGFYGVSAVLGDSISLKFWFKGDAFDGKTVTVNEAEAELETDGEYKFVETAVRARDFDTAITVAIDGVGSVTDSVSGYTSRLADENAANLVGALRAYGANAMRYSAAKDAAAQG